MFQEHYSSLVRKDFNNIIYITLLLRRILGTRLSRI